MDIRLLTVPGCPGAPPARALLHEVLKSEGLADAFTEIEVSDEQEAQQLGFLGSPTIHIDGLDIELAKLVSPACMCCRTYEHGSERLCQIPESMLREALRRAQAPKQKLLYLCTGNSCRSQMAEGLTRAIQGDTYDVCSAGIETHGLNPNAVKVMAELGVDISGHRSELVASYLDVGIDVVVTVCGHAHKTCPLFPGQAKVVHVGFDDPPRMAKELAERGANKEEQLDCYRTVRDQIRAVVEQLPESLSKEDIEI